MAFTCNLVTFYININININKNINLQSKKRLQDDPKRLVTLL